MASVASTPTRGKSVGSGVPVFSKAEYCFSILASSPGTSGEFATAIKSSYDLKKSMGLRLARSAKRRTRACLNSVISLALTHSMPTPLVLGAHLSHFSPPRSLAKYTYSKVKGTISRVLWPPASL